MSLKVLGISALYHDSAAALVVDGEIMAAAQEERFTRKKADASIPVNAINYCLSKVDSIDAVVYYDDPLLTLDRWLTNCVMVSPNNERIIECNYNKSIERLWIHERLRKAVNKKWLSSDLFVCKHHISHASSAFYPSPYVNSAIITMDGVGEWDTTTIGVGNGNDIEIIKRIVYPNSLGLFYSAFTYFCGFKVNFGEYKLMGLAPYGRPLYTKQIKENIIRISEDGFFELNQKYFSYMYDDRLINEEFERLFGVSRRKPESPITQVYMDIASSVQKVTEEIVLSIAKFARSITGSNNLCLAGGIALNCVANGLIVRNRIFNDVWIQPAAGDAGGALGCALYYSHAVRGVNRKLISGVDGMKGAYLGPDYSDEYIKDFLLDNDISFVRKEGDDLYKTIANEIARNRVVGICQGKMEFGPRALGNRSIIANPMSENMQSKLNLKIKYRESFRPFAPAVLDRRVKDYFDIDCASPYMLLTAPIKDELRVNMINERTNEDLISIINEKRSSLPAVTHVDYSARVQTVSKENNPFFYHVITEFERLTGCGVVVNTSFNVRGEPIVCTPEDAYACFMRTEMDVLVIENYIIYKNMQKKLKLDEDDWRGEYELD